MTPQAANPQIAMSSVQMRQYARTMRSGISNSTKRANRPSVTRAEGNTVRQDRNVNSIAESKAWL
jgi:hypothetical protein